MERSLALLRRLPVVLVLGAALAAFGSIRPPIVSADETSTEATPAGSLVGLSAKPVSTNPVVDYAAAVQVKLVSATGTQTLYTTANDVGAFFEEQGIRLGADDIVHPSLAELIVPGESIHLTRVMRWNATETSPVEPNVIHKLDFALNPNGSKVLAAGKPGLRQRVIAYTQVDGKLSKHTVLSRIVRAPRNRVVADGVGAYAAFANYASRGMEKTGYMASSAIDLLATAYTAGCYGCSGYTALGYRAGHGIVAVDPRVIPLGTHLYIPGYGFAIAGDTGGDIVGNRIDLGFDSYADAINFGRRVIRVYTLH